MYLFYKEMASLIINTIFENNKSSENSATEIWQQIIDFCEMKKFWFFLKENNIVLYDGYDVIYLSLKEDSISVMWKKRVGQGKREIFEELDDPTNILKLIDV